MTLAETALHAVCNWYASSPLMDLFPRAYVFGSLVASGGRNFQPISDIDLLFVFADTIDCPDDRVAALNILRTNKSVLEKNLLYIIRPENPHIPTCSFCVMDSIELRLRLHKSTDPNFFRYTTFFDIGARNISTVELTGRYYSSPQYSDILSFMTHNQSMRSKYVSVSAYDDVESITQTVGDDPLPKAFLRDAGKVMFFIRHTDKYRNDDISESLEYWSAQLHNDIARSLLGERVYRRLSAARLSRRSNESLENEDIIFLYE